jgi:tetratricopeptide (TPR) repeat protein
LLAEHYREAIMPLKRAMEIAPSEDIARALTIAAERATDAEVCLECYEIIEASGFADVTVFTNWGRLLADQNEVAEALGKFQLALNLSPQSANAYFNTGDLLYKIGAFDQAARLYESALKIDPTNAEGWFVFGNSLAQVDVTDAAIVAYNQVLTLNPEHRGARHNRDLMAA